MTITKTLGACGLLLAALAIPAAAQTALQRCPRHSSRPRAFRQKLDQRSATAELWCAQLPGQEPCTTRLAAALEGGKPHWRHPVPDPPPVESVTEKITYSLP